jgi:hypothetical protein
LQKAFDELAHRRLFASWFGRSVAAASFQCTLVLRLVRGLSGRFHS